MPITRPATAAQRPERLPFLVRTSPAMPRAIPTGAPQQESEQTNAAIEIPSVVGLAALAPYGFGASDGEPPNWFGCGS
ncbi:MULTISPECIES: hypothetical protein [Nocardioides]|uniref:Uncharacterized protein n=1 Tax=Nocardioides vastitatis TaxID=2568655 RepID=A0ABW0ZJP2_9ACTN|nr:hypothetical protein [Nocardioides sp.]THI93264.1 hypothetical protein E7Z54_21080 [Nocardioides sp.]